MTTLPWVSVHDRLPEYDDDRKVLCYTEGYDYGGTSFITMPATDFYYYDHDGDGEPGTAESRTVTHWMWVDDAIPGAALAKVA